MFGRTKKPVRTIPLLNPTYYQAIHQDLQRAGATDSLQAVARGVANAIFTTGMNYFSRLDNQRAAADFDRQFSDRLSHDASVGDAMIDHLIAYDRGTQEFLTTLLRRLREVLAKPA